jgi:hypothetical protein
LVGEEEDDDVGVALLDVFLSYNILELLELLFCCCTFAMIRPTIVGRLLQWQEFYLFFEWLLLYIPCRFEIPVVIIIMAFTL